MLGVDEQVQYRTMWPIIFVCLTAKTLFTTLIIVWCSFVYYEVQDTFFAVGFFQLCVGLSLLSSFRRIEKWFYHSNIIKGTIITIIIKFVFYYTVIRRVIK